MSKLHLPPHAGFVNTIRNLNAFELMYWLWRQGVQVDAIITDLPYGTTACSWDEIIPFAPMWAAVKRILKPRGVFVTTASQPFTSLLTVSNLKWFRCEWIWEKSMGTGYLNANRQPMKNHENIIVFSEGEHNYNPQMRKGKPYRATSGAVGEFVRDKTVGGYTTLNNGDRYPLSVIKFDSDTGFHPTQKPVELYEFLIRTYTQPGELVLDFCCGSGTTGVACVKTGRNYILNDISAEYVKISQSRVNAGFVTVDVAEGIEQPSLFTLVKA